MSADPVVHALAILAHAVDRDLGTPDLSVETERTYAHDWADFAAFCDRHGLDALPPQTLALNLKALESRRSRAPAALGAARGAGRHATEGLETPTDHPLVRPRGREG